MVLEADAFLPELFLFIADLFSVGTFLFPPVVVYFSKAVLLASAFLAGVLVSPATFGTAAAFLTLTASKFLEEDLFSGFSMDLEVFLTEFVFMLEVLFFDGVGVLLAPPQKLDPLF